jgi:hypothetical protein
LIRFEDADTMNDQPDKPSEVAVIDSDRSCIGCGYNLRTLTWRAKCPECGRDVLDSLGENLFSADRHWLKSMRLGIMLLMAQAAGVIGVALAAQFIHWNLELLPYLLLPIGPKLPFLLGTMQSSPRLRALAISVVAVYGVGIWIFTRAAAIESTKANELRQSLRGVGLVGSAITVIGITFQWGSQSAWLMVVTILIEMILMVLTYGRLATIAELGEAKRLVVTIQITLAGQMMGLVLIPLGMFLPGAALTSQILTGLVAAAGMVICIRCIALLGRAMGRET